MKLIGTIKNILMEESKRDLTSVIQTLLDGFVDDHKDILCKVEVKHPNKRIKLPHSDNNYENYRATFYLIAHKGGYSATRVQLMDNVMNEVWDLVYNYTGQKLDMFTKYANSCDDIIKEDKDRHFDGGDYQKHIVTFNNISPDCIKLIYKGTGKSY